MKFEEVLGLVSQGKNFEDFEMITLFGEWQSLWPDLKVPIVQLSKGNFRLRIATKEKIKRYQIIYKDSTKRGFFCTDPLQKYTAQEFKDSFHKEDWIYRRYFHAIIPESSEEFDE